MGGNPQSITHGLTRRKGGSRETQKVSRTSRNGKEHTEGKGEQTVHTVSELRTPKLQKSPNKRHGLVGLGERKHPGERMSKRLSG